MIYKRYNMAQIFKIKLSILLLIITSAGALQAQNYNKYKGLPFIKNYTTEEYNAHEQNFDIVQDLNGIMYFANFAGILEFDGTQWKKIVTRSGMRVLSLDTDSSGTVYAGGLMDFGYITHQKNGESTFISLTDTTDTEIGMIFEVLCDNERTYFVSEDLLYIYENTKVSKIKFTDKALSAFLLPKENQNELYIFFERDLNRSGNEQNGLTVFKNDKFLPVSDQSSSQIVDVQSIFKTENSGEFVVGTANQGLFLLKDNIIRDFNVGINNFLRENGLTCGVKNQKSGYAFGTFTGGIIISDKEGKAIQKIDKNSLLQDESVNALFTDKDHSLWAATNNGISKIEVNWNLSYIDNISSGLEGKVQDILEYNDLIYFATDNGLFYLSGSQIRKVNGIDFSVWDITLINNTLIAATTKGIYTVNNNIALQTQHNDLTFCVTRSSVSGNTFYTGHNGRIDVFRFENGNIQKQRSIQTIDGDVYKITDNSNSELYAEVSPGKIFRYSFDEGEGQEVRSEMMFISLHLNKLKDKIFFSSEKGLFQYNTEKNRIEAYNVFEKDTSSHNLWIHDIFEIDENKYIVTDGEQKNISFINMSNGKPIINQTPLLPVSNYSIDKMYFSATASMLWLGGKDGLILYNLKESKTFDSNFKTLIRSIVSLENDSLLDINTDGKIKLNYSKNSLRFEFSAPIFISKGKVYYRYILSGFDNDTSEWTEATSKDYTNIPNGKYTFSVEAKNEYGKLLASSEFQFEVLKPMYRRWWAFIIYAAALVFIISTYMRWRMKAVEKEREVLENTVRERTEEIAQSKEEIETQRDELYKQKQEIVDSINYAQRIQEAVLPSKEILDEVLKDYFVFYRPRDIVSGDFYWIKQIRNFSFAVAADCTGHGVPGAFMSMLGSSFLNEIVTSRRLDSAGDILNRLRNKVKKSLHQKGEEGEQKDGMDISIMIIDWDTLELQFAGAYNSLYIIRKDPESKDADEAKYEIERLKADRQPIGIYIHEKDFTNHSYQLKKGDTLYAFSDGYVDQFGGDTGGKFKSVRFKNMLLAFQDKSMEEQKHILERTFNKWKRDIDQVDDVLVMGIRIN
jgi:serine phosphatase RsbU (regulator of sigma subunit)/ligand-binding sensor domain-containing protein